MPLRDRAQHRIRRSASGGEAPTPIGLRSGGPGILVMIHASVFAAGIPMRRRSPAFAAPFISAGTDTASGNPDREIP